MPSHEPDHQTLADGQPPDSPRPSDAVAGVRALDTNDVVREIRAGDEQRFTELYERVAPALFAWLHLRLGPAARRRLDPEDVVQEIWLRALRAFPAFDPERGPFRGWIFQITKYELLDTFRDLAASALPTQPGPPTAADEPARDAAAPKAAPGLSQVPEQVTSFTRRIARDEGLQQLLAQVATLPKDEHALVLHCGLEGRPASEVAVMLGLTHEATRKRWQRLRSTLRSYGWVQKLFVESLV